MGLSARAGAVGVTALGTTSSVEATTGPPRMEGSETVVVELDACTPRLGV